MKKIVYNKYFLLAIRLVIGFIFIYAGVWKIVNPEEFAKSILNYRFLPLFLVNITAIVMPWLELILGLFIILGIMIKATSLLLIANMTAFCILILSAIFRSINIDCGCFSSAGSSMVGWSKLFEDIGLLVIAIIIYFSNNNDLSIEKYYSIKIKES